MPVRGFIAPAGAALRSAAWPPNVRVGANSPSLCPTMFSLTNTVMNLRPLCTARLRPTNSGVIVERRDQVLISLRSPFVDGHLQSKVAEAAKSGDRKLKLDPALTERLLNDIEEGGGKDALPLLAFTLERLFRQYGADGDLLIKEYEDLGGIVGGEQ